MTTRTPDKPGPTFNLDTFQNSLEVEPFAVALGGERFELTHLDLLDGWEVVDAFMGGEVQATVDLLKLALGDSWDEFRAKRVNRGGLDELTRRYLTHCGVDLGK